MAQTLAQKLRIDKEMKLLTLNAPAGFLSAFELLPAGVKASAKTADYAQIHWFVKNRGQMEDQLPGVLGLLKPGIICWIYYPKGSSGVQTDLTRDKGWEGLLRLPDLQWLSLISFDDTWSAFGMRRQNEADKKKAEKPAKAAERPILDYIDPVAKTVRLPDDLEKALKKNKQARTAYEALAYSHRKEYVEWIVTAKREETRKQRVDGTIKMLLAGQKNPRNI
jgi:Bacteriocin-protection, YdeI or OmpD-Associated